MSISSLLNGNAFRISIVLFFFSSIIMTLVSKVRKVFKKNKTHAIIYVLCLMAIFALTGLLSYEKVLNDSPLNSFIGSEIIFFTLGIGHIFVLRTFFKDLSENTSDFFSEFLFSLALLAIALLAYINVVDRFKDSFSTLFLTAGIAFLIPLLTLKMYEFAALIPVPVYKKWFLPYAESVKEPEAKDLANPLVISFEFKKNPKDKEISRFKVKAPVGMEFGKVFYFFVDDYNELHPEGKILINNSTGQQNGWIFYFKPYWWSSIKHIDANKTVEWNGIREENTIIVQRVS